MPAANPIATILRHDRKTTSYKIALIRAINDMALAYPLAGGQGLPVAVPLRMLAERWIAFYWPFVEAEAPIWQGARNRRTGGRAQDMAFRPELTRLRLAWEAHWRAPARPADGFLLASEMRVARRRAALPPSLVAAYDEALETIIKTLTLPIRYAGPGEWSVFERPARLSSTGAGVEALPSARPDDRCLFVSAEVWRLFLDLSLWVEALCIHEWSLFTETVRQPGNAEIERGAVYQVLTDRPDNRRPLTWERNQVDILLLEGQAFRCPWTLRRIEAPSEYDLGHLVPPSIYPTDELWNLAPTDARFNHRTKRDRLPKLERLAQARGVLVETYTSYAQSHSLREALAHDGVGRFGAVDPKSDTFAQDLAGATMRFVEHVADSRVLARF